MVDVRYYTIQEAAKVLACDDETILAQIHSGELPAVNIAKRLQAKRPTWRIAEGELGRWLLKRGNAAKQAVAPKPAKSSRKAYRTSVKAYPAAMALPAPTIKGV